MDIKIDNIPEIIKEAAQSTLGIFALMIIAIGLIAYSFFKNSRDTVKIAIFILLFLGVAAFGFAFALKVKEDNQQKKADTLPVSQSPGSQPQPVPQITPKKPIKIIKGTIKTIKINDTFKNKTDTLKRLPPPPKLLSMKKFDTIEANTVNKANKGSAYFAGAHIKVDLDERITDNDNPNQRSAKVDICYSETTDNCTFFKEEVVLSFNIPYYFSYGNKDYQLIFFNVNYDDPSNEVQFRLIVPRG